MLAIEDLHVDYGQIRAVRGVSFEVADGEIVTLVGPNGAGKSSVLNAVAGVVVPKTGDVRLRGISIRGMRPERAARLGLALVPESRRIFTRLTVEENLRLAAAALPRRDRPQAVAAQIARFEVLARFAARPAGTLSGGEQQQLAIARALVTNPQVVLFDEPSLGLAPLIVDQVFELIRALRDEGRTVLLVEQSVTRAVALADRAFLIKNGQVKTTGATMEDSGALQEFEASYLGLSR